MQEHFPDPRVRQTIEGAISLSDPSEQVLGEVALSSTGTATAQAGQPFSRLQSGPGMGQILALLLRYEMQASARFPRVPDVVSYCPLGKCAQEAGGNRLGTSGKKIGKVPLRWAFAAAAVWFLRHNQPGTEYLTK